MSRVGDTSEAGAQGWPRWLLYILILGAYFTLRGYHSLDNDQAYRLPLLLHQLTPSLYSDDPFVRAFEGFNPHRGSFLVLGTLVNLVGLSQALLILFGLAFWLSCRGLDRLACATWPRSGGAVGLLAVVLFLGAKAGNLGTNHLFEAMVLDRLLALALGWLALAEAIDRPERGWWTAPSLIGVATLIHPSMGLQLALSMAAAWALWCLAGRRTDVTWHRALPAVCALGVSVIPGLTLNLVPWTELSRGLSESDFWTLTVELQSPQHMLPHLWRFPQWMAWTSYLVMGLLALLEGDKDSTSAEVPPSRTRLVLMLVVMLAGLAVAGYAIEVLHHLRITLFQPFRMATVVRGLCLVLVSGRLVGLWQRGGWLPRLRAALIAVSFTGDWMLVAVTAVELAITLIEALPATRLVVQSRVTLGVFAIVLSSSLLHLSRHDTESGHRVILAVLGLALLVSLAGRWVPGGISGRPGRTGLASTRRKALALAVAWAVPLAALMAGLVPAEHPASVSPLVRGLVARCRFLATPIDDMERLAVWCRDRTPTTARFIGPPGPKTFRLWSRRSLAFNRAASPYGAAGLADWFTRFQDHVGMHQSPETFVGAYLSGRHQVESRYDVLGDRQLAALAVRQGADHVIGPAPSREREDRTEKRTDKGPLDLLHVEGPFAVYRVRPEWLARGREGSGKPLGRPH